MVAIVLSITWVILTLPPESRITAFIGVSIGSLILGLVIQWWERRHGHPLLMVTTVEQASQATISVRNILTHIAHKPLLAGGNRYFIISFLLICFAHYVMAQESPVLLRFVFVEWLDKTFRIGTDSLDNVVFGILLLIGGSYYFLRFLVVPPVEPIPPSPSSNAASLLSVARANAVPLLIAGVSFLVLVRQNSLADNSNSLIVIWLVVLVVLLVFGYSYDRAAKIPVSPGFKRQDIMLCLLIFALGLGISSYNLASIPNSILTDEGSFVERAHVIAVDQGTETFFGLGVYTFPAASIFYQGWIMKLFGSSLWSWRFGSVLIAVLALLPTYLLALELFGRRIAVLTGVIMSVTPYFISYARMGYNNSQAIFPVVLAFYFLHLAVTRWSMFYFILSGIIAGLGFYTYSAGQLGLVVGALYILYIINTQRRLIAPRLQLRKILTVPEVRCLVYLGSAFIFAAIVTITPRIIYAGATDPKALRLKTLESLFPHSAYSRYLYSEIDLYRDFPPIYIDDQMFFFRLDLYGNMLVRGFVRSVLAFHMYLGLTESIYNVAPLAGPVGTVFYSIGLLIALRLFRRQKYTLLGFWFVGALVLLSAVHGFPPRHTHLVSVIPAIAVFIALGIATCVDFIRANLPERRSAVSSVVSLAIVGAIAFTGLYNYFVEMPKVYLPNVENIIDFKVVNAQIPETVFYINSDPAMETFIPHMIQYLPHQSDYKTLSLANLTAEKDTIQPDKDYTFFFLKGEENEVLSFLKARFGIDEIISTEYKNANGETILFSWSFSKRAT
jgi:4-amino-4-deoxy-L-arabinose transferase-like glycosyltransferase